MVDPGSAPREGTPNSYPCTRCHKERFPDDLGYEWHRGGERPGPDWSWDDGGWERMVCVKGCAR